MKIKKFIAEFIGTAVLVFFGCGTAIIGTYLTSTINDKSIDTLEIALAFGFSLCVMYYAIGHISGCHINPAVSFAMLINGRISFVEFIGYVISQFAGGFAGCALLSAINSDIGGYYPNAYGEYSKINITINHAAIVELILAFVFVLVFLGATSSKKYENVAGLAVGAALTLVHIISIPLTGTSVNPARSLATAVFMGKDYLSQVWVFVLAPFAGAAVAGIVFKLLFSKKEAE